MEFKDKIKALRAEHNATLEDIGNAVGVSKTTVQRWESGEIANIRRDKIYKLAKALHTTPSYLMGWDDEGSDSPPPSEADPLRAALLRNFDQLNQEGRERLVETSDDMVASGKYIKNNPSELDQMRA